MYYNDQNTMTSREIRADEVSEILGMGMRELNDLAEENGLSIIDQANELAYGFSFSEEPEF